MNIETERCTLQPVTKADRHDVHQLYASKDVRRFLGGAVDETSFQQRFDAMLMRPDYNWIIRLKDSQSFVGAISIGPYQDGPDQEISYQVQKEFWSKGYAGEAVSSVMEYAAHTLKLPALVAETQDANEPSKKLLKKLGMHFEDTALRYGEKQAIFRISFAA